LAFQKRLARFFDCEKTFMKRLPFALRFSTPALAVALTVFTALPGATAAFAAKRMQTGSQAAPESAPRTLSVKGLRERATIRRDERGVAYVEAANETDLYFAQGYATAADRLWQMDLLRRTAAGELSEIFGRTTLDMDKAHRTLGLARVAEATAAQTPAADLEPLEAYARGVNAFIEACGDTSLPIEFRILQYRPRPWRPSDTFLIGKLFAEDLSESWPVDIERALIADAPKEKRDAAYPSVSPLDVLVVGSDDSPKPSDEKKPSGGANVSSALAAAATRLQETLREARATVGLDAEEHAASNNWVVSGKRTETGKPLLANDPHLRPSAPSIWHLVHLSAPDLRVAGVTAPGIPGALIGHNERIAWGCTNLGPDVQDLYLETFDPNNSRRYKTPAGWREAEVRTEEIKVRKNPLNPETETVKTEVTVTRHGPIILEENGKRYALRWTALAVEPLEFSAYYKLNRAKNWNDFRDALKQYRGATQNFVYADIDGHIGHYGAGRIPIRKSGDGSLPYDGATDDGEWTSFIPFDELPHVYDPPSGVIVTANSRIVGRSYPYFLTNDWASPFRSRRIADLIAAKPKLSIEDFRAIQGDAHSIAAERFARAIVAIARAANADDTEWKAAVAAFEKWDGRIAPDSREAALMRELMESFGRRIIAEGFGKDFAKRYTWFNRATFYLTLLENQPKAWLPKEFSDYDHALRACFRDARVSLTNQIGPDETQWRWGRIAKVRFPHPLAVAPIVGGQFAVTPFPQTGSGGLLATPNVGASVSMRFIASPANWDSSQMGVALGESGDPTSPHWKDQLDDWRAVTPREFPFTPSAVAAKTKPALILTPQQAIPQHSHK
jgi:penicillin G amidase